MHRTQLSLELWQYQSLQALAAQRSTSISAIVREWISERLAPAMLGTSTLSAIEGLANDPEGRGEDHDSMLYGSQAR